MNKFGSLLVCLALVVFWAGAGTASAQSLRITSHQHGDAVFYGAQVVLQCAGGTPPYAWSGPGSFSPATGSQVTWTAPVSGSDATVTVTDFCGDQASVFFYLRHVIFVDVDRGANGNGTTWLTAFKHLQDALAIATSGCEIWVAEGTYKPDEDKYHVAPDGTGDCWAYFNLLSGVSVYGGFAGNETSRDKRNWVTHPTILSGNLNENTTRDLYVDSWQVVWAYEITNAVLDGFTVTMGRAENTDGAGMWIYNYTATNTLTVANCIFRDNESSGDDADGGAMQCHNASPAVTNCIFIDNIAGDDGGALCNKNNANGIFTNCAFYSNETAGAEDSHGGAIFNTPGEAGGTTCRPTFMNCIVADNLTRIKPSTGKGGDGGGAADNGSGTSATWLNCTFYHNTAEDDGGGLASRDGGASTVTNCIFWANIANDNGSQLWQGGNPAGTANITYTQVQGGFTGEGNDDDDPAFLYTSDLDGPDNRFLTTDDGLQIDVGSPCIDSAIYVATVMNDAAGRWRPLDGSGDGFAYYDRGAYEFEVIVARKGPYLIYPGETTTPATTAQMTVLWQLNQTRSCTLEWGTSTNYGSTPVTTTENNNSVNGHQHSHTITGLQLGTKYYYRIRGIGAGSFWTAPAPAATNVNFLVFSDTQGSNGQPATNFDGVCAGMVGTFTDGYQTFALHCGDRVAFGGSEASWDNEFFARSQTNAMTLLADVPLLGCLGNHELRDAGDADHTQAYWRTTPGLTFLFKKYWPYPFMGATDTSYWSFNYGPVHVAIVDQYATGTFSGSNRVTQDQIDWLRDDLTNTNRPWKVVIFHQPGYAGVITGGSAYEEVRNSLQPIFDTTNVDVVFAGHRHYYLRSLQDGVTHITTGGAGGGLDTVDADDTNTPWWEGPRPDDLGHAHHFCRVAITGNTLTCTAVDLNGTAIETSTIQH